MLMVVDAGVVVVVVAYVVDIFLAIGFDLWVKIERH